MVLARQEIKTCEKREADVFAVVLARRGNLEGRVSKKASVVRQTPARCAKKAMRAAASVCRRFASPPKPT